ncbi:uncharacterized protein [Elaeis guineensis]
MRAATKASAVAKARHLLPQAPSSSLGLLSLPLQNPNPLPLLLLLLRRHLPPPFLLRWHLRPPRRVLLSEKTSSIRTDGEREKLRAAVSALADEFLVVPDHQEIAGVLDSCSADALFRRSPNGFASIELLSRLKSRPLLAL